MENLNQNAEVTEVQTQTEEQLDNTIQENNAINESLEERLAKLEEYENNIKQLQAQNEQLTQQINSNSFNVALRNEGLEIFEGLFELESNEDKVSFLKNAVNQLLVQNSYQPKDVAKQEQYTQAIQSGDVKQALGFKFSNLFKK